MLPFIARFSDLRLHDGPSSVPFAIGGASQRCTDDVCHANCQDALAIRTGPDYLCGVICDGCSSGHELNEELGVNSNNEVGAALVAYLIAEEAARLISKHRSLDDRFVKALSRSVLKRLTSLVGLFCGRDTVLRERFIFNFLMATVICAIVTKSNYIVLGLGDGLYAINSELHLLDEYSGVYLANLLLQKSCGGIFRSVATEGLMVYEMGFSQSLESIVLATDGYMQLHKKDPGLIIRLSSMSSAEQTNGCLDFLVPRLRAELCSNSKSPVQFLDDTSLITFSRTSFRGES